MILLEWTPCGLVEIHNFFKRTYCIHLQVWKISAAGKQASRVLLRNVAKLILDCTVSHSRRQYSSQSLPRKPQTSYEKVSCCYGGSGVVTKWLLVSKEHTDVCVGRSRALITVRHPSSLRRQCMCSTALLHLAAGLTFSYVPTQSRSLNMRPLPDITFISRQWGKHYILANLVGRVERQHKVQNVWQ
jgi:hypothetical protein